MIDRLARLARTTSLAALSLAPAPLIAQSTAYTRPDNPTVAGTQSVQLGGVTFANQGLVGIGRLAAATRDFAGETLGSFSGMALDLASWKRNADGTYSGSMWTLPDRGPNDVGPFVGTTNYRNRVQVSTLTLTPYTGTANLPQAPTSQNQLAIKPAGGFFLTDSTGANFTGKDGGSNVLSHNGFLYPSCHGGRRRADQPDDLHALLTRRGREGGGLLVLGGLGINMLWPLAARIPRRRGASA